jgi:hypothetical protein
MSNSIDEAIATAISAGPPLSAPAPTPPVPYVPQHIAGNVSEFMRRAKMEGMEAVAWMEAYSFMQQFALQQGAQVGVPFNGLPK